MSELAEKLDRIEAKATKLIEQNAQLKTMCEELSSARRQLLEENKKLKAQLANQEQVEEKAQPITEKVEEASAPVTVADQEALKKQIDQYIKDINASIKWLKKL